MPGLKNGSSLANAKEWDHSQHPQGIRVYGRIESMSPFNQDDWWELKLDSGTTYTIQTRTPTTFDSILTLYNSSQTQLALDDDSGDDGAPLSKISFNPTTSGNYYIKVSNKIWGLGTYTLECSPFPGMYWDSWGKTGGRFDAQGPPPARIANRFTVWVDPEPPVTAVGSRFSAQVDSGLLRLGSRFHAHD